MAQLNFRNPKFVRANFWEVSALGKAWTGDTTECVTDLDY